MKIIWILPCILWNFHTASSLNLPQFQHKGNAGDIKSKIHAPIAPGPHNYWPNAKIPYVVDPTMDSHAVDTLHEAIADYHNKTCLRWVQRTSESAYVRFKLDRNGNGCAAADNCYTGGQRLVYMERCTGRDTFIHEMGHTLCYGHEQDRNDKDNYIKDCANYKYEHLNFGHLYDFRSIMHYNCDDCRVPTLPGVSKSDCGSPNGLSVLDAEKINDIYRCSTGCTSYRFRFPDQLDGSSRLVAAGNEGSGQTLYVCRAYIQGDIVPGKASFWEDHLLLFSTPSHTCWVGWGGGETRIEDYEKFEILTNPNSANLSWMRWKEGRLPFNAIPGGRTVKAETLYIGRCRVQLGGKQNLVPGKILATRSEVMLYPYGGREHRCTNMDLLVCRT